MKIPAIASLLALLACQQCRRPRCDVRDNALSHMPPGDWLCYSAAGASGASSASIALAVRGVAAVKL